VRGVNAKTLRRMVTAIWRAEAIEVKYQSLSRPEPRWRWIVPHAIGFDGFRWHTTAFCLTGCSFKDFLFSRIIETRGTQPSDVGPEADGD
jgi:predicted DNA-binding transcriptional regulator YafY